MIRYFSMVFSYLIFWIVLYAVAGNRVHAPHAIQIIGPAFLLGTIFFVVLLVNEQFFGRGVGGFVGATFSISLFVYIGPAGENYAFYVNDHLVRTSAGLTTIGKVLFYRDLIMYSIVNAAGMMLGHFLVRQQTRMCERFRLSGGG